MAPTTTTRTTPAPPRTSFHVATPPTSPSRDGKGSLGSQGVGVVVGAVVVVVEILNKPRDLLLLKTAAESAISCQIRAENLLAYVVNGPAVVGLGVEILFKPRDLLLLETASKSATQKAAAN